MTAADTRTGSIINRAGFTLIELMIVMTIIGILAAISVPSYKIGLIKAREAVLRENLYSIRAAIDQFAADQGRYPNALKELTDKQYLRDIPPDPFTNSKDTWVTIAPPEQQTLTTGSAPGETPATEGGIYDVHSGSNLVGTNNVPYNEW